MNPKESSEVTIETLLALRQENDALRLITEKLRVKEMGPADHIRTKHEVKAFIQSGEKQNAGRLIAAASERISSQRTLSQTFAERQAHGQNM